MDLKKAQAILDWPTPRSMFEARILHGLESFYSNSIKNFNSMCSPIIDTIKGERREFKWIATDEQIFNILKKR